MRLNVFSPAPPALLSQWTWVICDVNFYSLLGGAFICGIESSPQIRNTQREIIIVIIHNLCLHCCFSFPIKVDLYSEYALHSKTGANIAPTALTTSCNDGLLLHKPLIIHSMSFPHIRLGLGIMFAQGFKEETGYGDFIWGKENGSAVYFPSQSINLDYL